MHSKFTLQRLHQSLKDNPMFQSPIPFWRPGSMWARRKSTGEGKPKQKIYHRVPELDKAMDLQKKPSMILQLKSIIQSQKHQSLLLQDLEKEVGHVKKWNFIATIEKYPTIFHVGSGNGSLPFVTLTAKAEKIAAEEDGARAAMEPILVMNLRKLLMLSVDCRVPLEKIEFIEPELGLPPDFKNTLIPKYPEFFSVKAHYGKDCLQLENWDSSLAVTAREERLMRERVLDNDGDGNKIQISKDGNFLGPHAFKMRYPTGFRPNMHFLWELEKWQKKEFPSPYLNARRFEVSNVATRKRIVAVLHELLSLTMMKRMTSVQMSAFQAEFFLPSTLLRWLIRLHGIFYITNKGVWSTVFLKDAYEGSSLIDKCPLVLFNDKFVALSGRQDSCHIVS